jgi:Na+/glutamate symporter
MLGECVNADTIVPLFHDQKGGTVSRRRTSRRNGDYDDRRRGGKSNGEARIELMTWALLVGVIALGVLGREINLTLPNWFIPFAGAVVMLGSGFYQYSRGYRVSPITWLGGVVLVLFLAYSMYVDPTQQFGGASLIVFFFVILFGIITGDT